MNQRVKTHEQFKNQIISKFFNQSIDQDINDDWILDRLQSKTDENHSQQDHNTEEITNSDLIRSSIDFQLAVRNKFSTIDNNESILQRIDDYQLIINTLYSPENNWTDETTEQLITKLQTLVNINEVKKEEDVYQLLEKNHHEFYLQIKELIGIEEDHPEAIINKIKELFETSQVQIDENEKLLVSTSKLNENYHRLEEEHQKLVQSNSFHHS